ncbi:MAG TPA: PKD domain-containing protein [Bacteroidia bacterium]|nr:PKD domain-containing protein [Bacteroidia bacterium]
MKKILFSLVALVCLTFSFTAKAQTPPCSLKAKFEYKTDKCTVYFKDFSTADTGTTITNWHWSFGDGTNSNVQNPTYTYSAAGTYTVCLTVVGKNAKGEECKNQFCAKVTVEGCGQSDSCKLKADLSYKIYKCEAMFAGFGTTGPGTTITNWFWSFGDGGTSTLQNPNHTYTTAGTYTVCLTIVGKNAKGEECKDKMCREITAIDCGQTEPCKIAPRFEFKVEKCTVQFFDVSAVGTGTTITNWYWDMGDGSTSTVQNPSHTYATAGTYAVCLTIVGKNAKGEECKDQFCTKVTVDGCGQDPCGVKPLFQFKIDKCTVYFADQTGTNTGTTITAWAWTFGDGTSSNVQNPTHTYATAGTYKVCLTVYGKNAAGAECKNTYCKEVTVEGCGQEPCGVKPLFEAKIDKCTAYFIDQTGTNPGTTITSWLWSFNDGTNSTVQNPTHTYATAGTYNVCLTVYAKNAAGVECKNTYCRKITVDGCGQTDSCKLKAIISYKIGKCDVMFSGFATTGSGTTVTNWLWSFGDGTTSTLQNPTHIYATAGTYTACLTVVGKNAKGEECKDKVCQEVRVIDCGQTEPCKVAGKFDYKVDGCKVYFTDYSATAPGTVITYWEWIFGDGNTTTGVQNPSHVYAAPGNYVVCLIIVGTNKITGEQCKDKVCLDIVVKDCDPKQCAVYPKFDYKAERCKVNFIDYSATGTGTTITNWLWSFGDGSTSTLQNPSHVYAAPGTYEVCLIVVGKNAAGVECKDRICLKVIVGPCDKKIAPNELATISAFEIFPNPAQRIVNISFKNSVASQVNVSISDIQGRVLDVIQEGEMATGNHNLIWNVSVGNGLYLITIRTDAGIEQRKLLIQE